MSKSLHILLVHQAFVALDEAGGTRHYEFARYLAQHGHRVTVIASQTSYLTGTDANKGIEITAFDGGGSLNILRVRTLPGLHRSFARRILNFFSFTWNAFWAGLRVKDVDVVWGTTPPIFQAAGAWALARLKRAPLMLEVRDLWPAFAIAVGVLHNPLLIAASEWLERLLYRGAHTVLLNSPGFTAHVQARGARRVRLVPNGADAAMFDPQADGAAFRAQHALQGKFVALYAGAHGLSNDLGVLLQAAEQLRAHENIQLVLVGDGKDKSALQAQAAAMQLPNVRFIPPLAKEDMATALAAADVCIAILKPLPLYATVYPNKVFDYLAAGRAVALAIDGVIRQVVADANAGVFVPPGDPQAMAATLLHLSTQPEQGRAMGAAGRAFLEAHFNRPQLASQLEAMLLEMVATQGQ
ncbi:MAG: glycosyltransferase family 4 protein [Anaerolineales bacterium]|nr:MAG: glycosyltransferase family 4 protein [Anaerolineales bacterium]